MPSFFPQGVCASRIDYEIDDEGRVHDVVFTRGCSGNARGLARLAEGRPAAELIELLADVPCKDKQTSCPAELARALAEQMEQDFAASL
jgi:uncharacterized protein (TIGR03905 family)